MRNIFLDTNIIIDFLADRKPFSFSAAKIFNYAFHNKIKIYLSAISYNNIYYILKRSLSNVEAIRLLGSLFEKAEIADVTKDIVSKSLKTNFSDFEDAIQYNCALSVKAINFIVTRNMKDFKKSILPILTPEEAISAIKND